MVVLEDQRINTLTLKNEVEMKINVFLDLVEFRTKVASVIPFIAGIIFTLYRYNRFEADLLALFFISMLCIDMATTAMNHFSDSKRAINKSGYNYESHNAVNKYDISLLKVKSVIGILLLMGATAGLFLFIKTDLVILFVGILAFAVGILYSNGPIPISSIPLGEIVSGLMMGGMIFFVTVYIQVYDLGHIIYQLNGFQFSISVDLLELLVIALASGPLVLMISNIMLSNNLCDLEDDIINKRYTLPYYAGKKLGLLIYAWSYYFCYILIVIGVILTWLPATSLLTLLTIFPVYKNIKTFKALQDKASTFSLAIKNFFIIALTYIVSIAIALFGLL